MTRIFMALAAVLSVAPSAVSAQSAEAVVKLSQSDLASESRVRARAASAIEELCGSYAAVEPYQWPAIDQCRHSAWRNVDRQIAALGERKAAEASAR